MPGSLHVSQKLKDIVERDDSINLPLVRLTVEVRSILIHCSKSPIAQPRLKYVLLDAEKVDASKPVEEEAVVSKTPTKRAALLPVPGAPQKRPRKQPATKKIQAIPLDFEAPETMCADVRDIGEPSTFLESA